MPIRGGGARVSAWSACRTENGSAVSELRCRSASAASWSGPAEGPTEYKVAARRFAPNGELPSDYRSAFLQRELDRETPIQALTIVFQFPLQYGFEEWEGPDPYGPMPELPKPRQRWTVRRKAAVVEAVRGGWIPIEEACELYSISVDEFLAWERDLDLTVSTVCAARAIEFIAIPKAAAPP